MIKGRYLISLILLIFVIFFALITRSNIRKNESALANEAQTVYRSLFADGMKPLVIEKVDAGLMAYYAEDGAPSMVPLSNFASRNIKRVYSSGSTLFLVLGESLDDERGLLVTSSNMVDMDGLWSIKRLGGNTFLYDTRSP